MSDGIYEPNNRSPGRGRKLRNQGSNPTGDQTMSFTPEYSGEMDHAIGMSSLNTNVRRSNPLEIEKSAKASRELRGKTGLISKEPLL